MAHVRHGRARRSGLRAVVDRTHDRDAAIVLLTAAVCLTLIEYLARRDGSGLVDARTQSGQLAAWALVSHRAAYVVLPVLVTVFVLRRPLRDLGLRTDGVASHWRAYAVLYSIALPAS